MLRRRQFQAHFLLDGANSRVRVQRRRQRMIALRKPMQGASDAQLGEKQRFEIDQRRFRGRLAHHVAGLSFRLDGVGHDFARNVGDAGLLFQQRRVEQRRFRIGDVAFLAEALQEEADGGAGAVRRLRIDAETPAEVVGRLEADAPDVGGQAIRVAAHHVDGLIAIGLVDADGAGRADAVRLKKDHDGADGFVLLPAFADALNAARADALDFLEERRTFVDDGKGALAENFDDFVGQMRADAFDEPGTKVLFDAFESLRRRAAQLIGLELLAVIAILHPGAGRLDVFAGRDRRYRADDGDEAAPAARLDAQHREPSVGVVKGDALDHTGQ